MHFPDLSWSSSQHGPWGQDIDAMGNFCESKFAISTSAEVQYIIAMTLSVWQRALASYYACEQVDDDVRAAPASFWLDPMWYKPASMSCEHFCRCLAS
jgi:hypothetical protein